MLEISTVFCYNFYMMIQNKGYKFRIDPTSEQKVLIDNTLGCARFVYNYFLALRQEKWESEHKSLTYVETSCLLTSLKRNPDFVWLSWPDSMALQESLRNLDRAYQNFFEKRSGYPRFKRKFDHHQSYRTRNQSNNIRIEGKYVILPKLGKVRIKLHRSFNGRILNATVSKTPTGKYYVSLCVEEEVVPKSNAGNMVGIDVGLTEFYTDSHGNTVDNPRVLAQYQKKLAREQRKLSRMEKGSKNRAKQRVRVARVHEKIYNIRMDFLHKQSLKLVSENQVIGIEDLNVKGMMKNHHLAKAISDVSWFRFITLLEHKGFEHGCEIRRVPTFYPSSQTCSECGYKNPLVKNLAVRKWICPECGSTHLRDHNAAINILNKALNTA